MYKRWRVYSTFLTGFCIGLFYALLIGNPWYSESSDPVGPIEWRVLVLAFSGILGGVIYAIVINGEVEMPRFVVDRSGVFKAGLFGDILLGIAGAFILELILPANLSVIDPPVSEAVAGAAAAVNATADAAAAADATGLEGSVIAATGIIGGYGGRAIIKFSLERFFKYTGSLDEFRANAILEQQAQRTSQRQTQASQARQAPELSTNGNNLRADEHTASLIDQIDRYVQGGLPEGDRIKLTQQLQSEPDSVRQAVFSALVELREEVADGLSNDQLQRMAGLFDTLIQVSPDEHPLYYQLAVIGTELTPPTYAEALAAVDKAIALRGPLTISESDISEPWQYELHRAVINIGESQSATEDFTISATAQEAILADLETIAQVYNLDTILKAADKQQIPRPVVNWIRYNPEIIEGRESLSSLLPDVRTAIDRGPLKSIASVTKKPEIGYSATAGSSSEIGSSSSGSIAPAKENTADSQGAVFPKSFSALGRCYDILSLDPFKILGDGSAKTTQVFDFYAHEAQEELDEKETILIPKGTRYTPVSGGQMDVETKSNLLYTESDVQKMFGLTLGSNLTQLMGAILPFSLSTSYAKFKRDRTVKKSVYAFTKADYVHYTLALDSQQSATWHLNETFRQAVLKLPLISNYEYLNFIDDFGTHTAVQVAFGGLFHHRYCLSKSSYASIVQEGGNVSTEAKRAFEAKYENKREGSTFKEFSNSSEVYDFCGGMKKENIHDWFDTIKADPAPIHLELMPLHELLDSRFFPEDEQIIKKRSLLASATQTYLEKNSEAISWELWPSATVGSNDGESFSDLDLAPIWLAAHEDNYKTARVKEVRIWIKDWVEGVQIVLEGDRPPFPVHGSEDGDLHTLKLDPDDYITAVSVRAPSTKKRLGGGGDTYIGSIRMHTHKQRIWTVGKYDSRALALDIPDGYQVIGFQGRSDKRIEKLGVISIPVAQ